MRGHLRDPQRDAADRADVDVFHLRFQQRAVTLPEPFQNALILTGPTGSGKTALALELALGLNAEIIAMDSMTLYRGMDIGTAKPGVAERSAVPHHLLDVLDPWESGNV